MNPTLKWILIGGAVVGVAGVGIYFGPRLKGYALSRGSADRARQLLQERYGIQGPTDAEAVAAASGAGVPYSVTRVTTLYQSLGATGPEGMTETLQPGSSMTMFESRAVGTQYFTRVTAGAFNGWVRSGDIIEAANGAVVRNNARNGGRGGLA